MLRHQAAVLGLTALLFRVAYSQSSPVGFGLSRERSYIRDYFYVGGHYADDVGGQHVFKDQMYVERLLPTNGTEKPHPIVLVHGQAQTGTVGRFERRALFYTLEPDYLVISDLNLLNKPDGGSGWATFYTSRGYTMYIVDQTFRGRSPWVPGHGTLTTYSAEVIQKRFTAVRDYNLWPQAHLHTQWPGSGRMGDATFDAYYASSVQFLSYATYQQSTVQAAGAILLDRIGKSVILMSHSQGGLMPWLIADARPELVHSIISLEPTGPPFEEAIFSTGPARIYGLTDISLNYSPPVENPAVDLVRQTIAPQVEGQIACIVQASSPPPRQLVNLKNIPTLVLTTQATHHVPYDWCTVKYLRQAGVMTQHLFLPYHGIYGNGHLVFLERNSDEVAQLLLSWIEKSND